MGRWTADVAEALRTTFRREALPPPPPPRPTGARAPGLLASLFAAEALPPPAPAPPPDGPPRRGLLSLLLAPEPLPPDLPPTPGRAGRWLAWLLAPESLEP